ncbi:hypothetical protein G6F50_015191 [Rhizopus delemar]|uniref:Uncharacterized protein n=1 Tax=Rhizopus delemar TaxID=936053 RepID=A0A9P7C5F0_9FUNG|nr:hypothetical protein G6F50_015191 [Rhizopus delemar]
MAGDVPGGFDSLAQGRFGKVGGRGGPAALAGVDRQVQRAISCLLNGFDIVLSDRDRQAQAFRDFRRGVGSADLARVGEAKSVIAQFSMNSHTEEESVDDGYDENGYDRPSKSQVKREMHALLDLGKQLIELRSAWRSARPAAKAAAARSTSWAS